MKTFSLSSDTHPPYGDIRADHIDVVQLMALKSMVRKLSFSKSEGRPIEV